VWCAYNSVCEGAARGWLAEIDPIEQILVFSFVSFFACFTLGRWGWGWRGKRRESREEVKWVKGARKDDEETGLAQS
jgi:hypothetical protein